MSNLKIAIRVDSSVNMGAGHVMRCITLADQLAKEGCECVFITRKQVGDLSFLIEKKGHKVYLLPEHTSEIYTSKEVSLLTHASWLGCAWQVDAEQTCYALAGINPDWLIVDHYALDARWETVVKVGLKLMVIDDLADRAHICDLLLDQNLGRNVEDYSLLVPKNSRCLIGPEYGLLRPEFAELRSYSLARRDESSIKKILISMGGVDKDNATINVLETLNSCELPKDCSVDIVMGTHAPWLKQVKDRALKMRYPTNVLVDIENMAEIMADADLSIGAAGGTSWERCSLGLPSFLMLLAENQRINLVTLLKHGVAKKFDLSTFSLFLTDSTLSNLRHMSIASSALCDGSGVNRVTHALLFGDGHKKVALLPAILSDCDYIYSLQTHPTVRQFFRNIDLPDYNQHYSWYKKKLADLNTIIFKIEFEGREAGIIRIENLDISNPEISIIISSEFEGKRIGTEAVRIACKLFPNRQLSAVVHAKNVGSLKLFDRAEFIKVGKESEFFLLKHCSK